MFRRSGMKIFDKLVKTAQQNFSAIFFPGDAETDKFLREIENPTHDFFDPEVRIDDPSDKKKAKDRYERIEKWIKNKINDYTKINVTGNDFLDGMEEYIQLEDNEIDESKIKKPDIEIISYTNDNISSLVKEAETSKGSVETTLVKPKKKKSKKKKKGNVGSSGTEGNDNNSVIKTHNEFQTTPKIIENGNNAKVAFALENYHNPTFNIMIESIGEDNSASREIPKIIKAIDLNKNEELTNIKDNIIYGVSNSSSNSISIEFDSPFDSKYRINVCVVGGEKDES